MSDTYTVVTRKSWFGRIGNSFVGILLGLLLIVAMIVLLFWNEGRAVTTARSLDEGAASVISVNAGSVDAEHEGRLIHVSGPLATDSTPADDEFDVSAPGVRLVRNVEMYQWIESSKSESKTKIGGGEETVTTYTYAKGWDDDWHDSSDFKKPAGHSNPAMELRSATFQVPNATLGAFSLDKPVLDQIGGEEKLAIAKNRRDAVDAAYQGGKPVSITDGRIYLGRDPTSPALGDYRVAYEVAPLGPISVVGRQAGDRFEPYQTAAGDRLLMVDRGEVPADKMFADAKTANTTLTWILRAVGLVLLFIGFTMAMAPIAVIADVIPPLGSVVRMGTGLLAFFFAVIVATIVIAIAWFYYRPLLAILILAIGAAVAAGIVWMARMRRPAAAAPAGAQFGRAA